MQRQVEMIPLAELHPDPANPKEHDLHTLDGSLARFGYVENISRDDRTGYIVSGHGRLQALRDRHANGYPPPDGVTVNDDGDWLIPVNTGWSSKDDAEARGALVALNRVGELGGWVDSALYSVLDELDTVSDLDGIGYDTTDLDIMRRRLDAESIFDDTEGEDAGSMADEFGKITGDTNQEYDAGLAATITVKVKDVASLRQFMKQTGLRGISTRGRNEGGTVYYPPGWNPKDDNE